MVQSVTVGKNPPATSATRAIPPMKRAIQSTPSESATRLAHTLKGVAGNLGVGPVQTAAAAVETLLRDEAPADATNRALEQLADVLDPFLARLRAALATGATTPAVPPVAPARTGSRNTCTTAFSAGFTSSMRARCAAISSSEEICPSRIKRPCAVPWGD